MPANSTSIRLPLRDPATALGHARKVILNRVPRSTGRPRSAVSALMSPRALFQANISTFQYIRGTGLSSSDEGIPRRLCCLSVASLSLRWRRHHSESDKLRLSVCSNEGLDQPIRAFAALFHSSLTADVRKCRLINNGLQVAKSAQQDAKAWPPLDAWEHDEPQLWLPLLLQCRAR
jgi:hypothetical protein